MKWWIFVNFPLKVKDQVIHYSNLQWGVSQNSSVFDLIDFLVEKNLDSLFTPVSRLTTVLTSMIIYLCVLVLNGHVFEICHWRCSWSRPLPFSLDMNSSITSRSHLMRLWIFRVPVRQYPLGDVKTFKTEVLVMDQKCCLFNFSVECKNHSLSPFS